MTDETPLSEVVDDPQLSSALSCVEETPAADDVPAWVGIYLYDALATFHAQHVAALALHERRDDHCHQCSRAYAAVVPWPCPTAEALGATS